MAASCAKGLREPQIKAALIDGLFSEGMIDDDAVVVSEMPIAGLSRRADLVLANGRLVGFEIKSDGDKTVRLAGQIEAYSSAFEGIVVITGARHLDVVLETVPEAVGIFCIEAEHEDAPWARLVRRPHIRKLDLEAAIRQMRAGDLFRLARAFEVVSASVRDRDRLERAVRTLPLADVRKAALDAVKRRYRSQFADFLRARNANTPTLEALSHLRRPSWNTGNHQRAAVGPDEAFEEAHHEQDVRSLRLDVRPRRAV